MADNRGGVCEDGIGGDEVGIQGVSELEICAILNDLSMNSDDIQEVNVELERSNEICKGDMPDGVIIVGSKNKDKLILDGNDKKLVSQPSALINQICKGEMPDGLTIVGSKKNKDKLILDGNDKELVSQPSALINQVGESSRGRGGRSKIKTRLRMVLQQLLEESISFADAVTLVKSLLNVPDSIFAMLSALATGKEDVSSLIQNLKCALTLMALSSAVNVEQKVAALESYFTGPDFGDNIYADSMAVKSIINVTDPVRNVLKTFRRDRVVEAAVSALLKHSL